MTNTTIIIIIIIIVIIIIAIVIFFVAFPSKNTRITPTPLTTPTTPIVPTNAVRYGDNIRLFNATPTTGGFLVICGGPFPNSESICTQNVSVVNADDNINDVWKILPAPDSNITTGSAIRYGDSVIIQSNVNNNNLGYCATTGTTTCGINVGTRNSMTSNDASTKWTFRLPAQNNMNMTINNTFVTTTAKLNIINNRNQRLMTICGSANGNNCGRNVTDTNTADTSTSLSTWQISIIPAT